MSIMYPSLFSQLLGWGHYVPAECVLNEEYEQDFGLEAGWIAKRTGIKARRFAKQGELLVDLAEKAGFAALKNAGIATHEIGLTILATSTPDRLLPPTAPLLTHRLGLSASGAYDLSGACSGFLYALAMADGFVRTQAKGALVLAANILSRRLNLLDLNSAILFGDAAAAVVMMPTTQSTKGLLGLNFLTDGSAYDLIEIAAGGSEQPFTANIPLENYKMRLKNGGLIFAKAVKMMTHCASLAIKEAKLTVADIHHFIPHQANERMIKKIANQLGIPASKTLSIVAQYGNSSAAGIPLALSLAHLNRSWGKNEKILLTTAGAGMTAAGIVLGL